MHQLGSHGFRQVPHRNKSRSTVSVAARVPTTSRPFSSSRATATEVGVPETNLQDGEFWSAERPAKFGRRRRGELQAGRVFTCSAVTVGSLDQAEFADIAGQSPARGVNVISLSTPWRVLHPRGMLRLRINLRVCPCRKLFVACCERFASACAQRSMPPRRISGPCRLDLAGLHHAFARIRQAGNVGRELGRELSQLGRVPVDTVFYPRGRASTRR